MTLRLIVIGLVVINIFIWGWAALGPQTAPGSADTSVITQTKPPEKRLDLPAITLARESAIQSPGGSQSSRQCFTLGPLRSRSVMQTIRDELSSFVVELDWHQTSSVVEQGFLVYMEPFGSYAQASEAVSQLIANGVRDYYIMPDGQYTNAVSVGLYEQRSQAQTRIRDIEALGLGWPLAMEMQRKDEPRFWLDFELRPDREIAVEELIAEDESAQHLKVPCPENEASFPPT